VEWVGDHIRPRLHGPEVVALAGWPERRAEIGLSAAEVLRRNSWAMSFVYHRQAMGRLDFAFYRRLTGMCMV